MVMSDLGEILEKLGRRLEGLEGRFGSFEGHFRDGDDVVEEVTRELVFGEEPELFVSANFMAVDLREAAADEAPHVTLRGHHVRSEDLEVGTRDGAVTVDFHPHRNWQTLDFRSWRSAGGHMRMTIAVPRGTRVHARLDAGKLSAERMHDSELDLRSDAGKLQLEDCSGRLRLASSAGKIALTNFVGTLEARTDAGAFVGENVRLTGSSTLRASAGSVRCSGLSLEAGEHTVESSLGSVRLGLKQTVPLRIEASATLGSVRNEAGSGPPDAPVVLRARTELGSIRIYNEQPQGTPMRRVPVTDEREASSWSGGRIENPEQAPREPAPAPSSEETLRILGMVERHEITAGEAAALIAALRGERR
jgi:hypothetical protein